MTRSDIIKMAKEAGFVVDEKAQQHQPNCIFHTHHMVDELLERFAALVAAAERERIIQFLREMQRVVGDAHNHYGVAAVRIKEGV